MLRFFRINDPYRLIVIFLILVGIRIAQGFLIEAESYYGLKWLLLGEWLGSGYAMYSQAYDYTGPLAAAVYKYTYMLMGRHLLVHQVLSTLLIIYQAALFNGLLLRNKAYAENSYLPAFLFVILMVGMPDYMLLSPQLLSLTFILLGLRNILRRIDNQVTDELFLNSGIFIGIATMLYAPAAVFFLVFLFSLVLFSNAAPRRLALYVFGFMLIFGGCAVFYYLKGSLHHFLWSFLGGLWLPAPGAWSFTDRIIVCAALLFVFLISLIKVLPVVRLTSFQQKIQQVMWLLMLGGIATFFLSNEDALFELVFCVPIIAYFWVHYFLLLKRRIFKALMPGLMILGLLCYGYYSYGYFPDSLRIQDQPAQKDAMLWDEDFSFYQSSKMLTPCFNEYLFLEAIGRLVYYPDASSFYLIMEKSQPELILDSLNVGGQVFSRFEILNDHYKKVGQDRYERISN